MKKSILFLAGVTTMLSLVSCANGNKTNEDNNKSQSYIPPKTDITISSARVSGSGDFRSGYAWVKIDDMWCVINTNGEVIGCNSDIKGIETSFSKTGYAIVHDSQTSGMDIIDVNGNVIYSLQDNESILSFDEFYPDDILPVMDYGYLFIARNEDTWERSGYFIYRLDLSNGQMEDYTYLFTNSNGEYSDPGIIPIQNGWFLIDSDGGNTYADVFYHMQEDKTFQLNMREIVDTTIFYDLVHDNGKVYYFYDQETLYSRGKYIRLDFLENPEYSEKYTVFTLNDDCPENRSKEYRYAGTINSGILLYRDFDIELDDGEDIAGFEVLVYDIDSGSIKKTISPNIDRSSYFVKYDESQQRVAIVAENDVHSTYFNVYDNNGEFLFDWVECSNSYDYDSFYDECILLNGDYAFVYSNNFNTKVYDINTGEIVKELPGEIITYDESTQIICVEESGEIERYYDINTLEEFLCVSPDNYPRYESFYMHDGYINGRIGEYVDRNGNMLEFSDPNGLLIN